MLTTLDWFVVAIYLSCLVAMSLYLSRRQETAEDYFVASNSSGPISIALSVMATQCSTNSILGAPAFCRLCCRRWTRLVAVRAGAAVSDDFYRHIFNSRISPAASDLGLPLSGSAF